MLSKMRFGVFEGTSDLMTLVLLFCIAAMYISIASWCNYFQCDSNRSCDSIPLDVDFQRHVLVMCRGSRCCIARELLQYLPLLLDIAAVDGGIL